FQRLQIFDHIPPDFVLVTVPYDTRARLIPRPADDKTGTGDASHSQQSEQQQQRRQCCQLGAQTGAGVGGRMTRGGTGDLQRSAVGDVRRARRCRRIVSDVAWPIVGCRSYVRTAVDVQAPPSHHVHLRPVCARRFARAAIIDTMLDLLSMKFDISIHSSTFPLVCRFF
ncbi:unnamed protein product, partial [Nesidiocoris tenuis]